MKKRKLLQKSSKATNLTVLAVVAVAVVAVAVALPSAFAAFSGKKLVSFSGTTKLCMYGGPKNNGDVSSRTCQSSYDNAETYNTTNASICTSGGTKVHTVTTNCPFADTTIDQHYMGDPIVYLQNTHYGFYAYEPHNFILPNGVKQSTAKNAWVQHGDCATACEFYDYYHSTVVSGVRNMATMCVKGEDAMVQDMVTTSDPPKAACQWKTSAHSDGS